MKLPALGAQAAQQGRCGFQGDQRASGGPNGITEVFNAA
jgi:hypothetical protein